MYVYRVERTYDVTDILVDNIRKRDAELIDKFDKLDEEDLSKGERLPVGDYFLVFSLGILPQDRITSAEASMPYRIKGPLTKKERAQYREILESGQFQP